MMNKQIFSSVFSVKKLNEDTKAIEKFCLNIKKNNKSRIRSNEGGYQCGFNPSLLPVLINKITLSANEFGKKNFNLIRDLKLSNIWVNINRHKDSNTMHCHPRSIISGVYYVKTPKKCGDLVFHHPNFYFEDYLSEDLFLNHNEINSARWFLPAEEDNLILFPSWIHHSVAINESKENRISISFNFNVYR